MGIAGLAAVLLCAAGAAAPGVVRAGTGLGAPVAVPGSAPVVSPSSHALGRVPAAAPISAVVYLKPRNAALLERTAMRSSGRRPLSWMQIQQRFMPTAATVARVRAYLAGEGLTVTSSSGLSVRVSGSAVAAGRAFGAPLEVYRDAHGRVFRAPAGALRMPSSIASEVQAVGGLQTNLQLHAIDRAAAVVPHTFANCVQAQDIKALYGGELPQDLQTHYGFSVLQESETPGETIGLVEFSAYPSSDITGYRKCVTGISGTVTNVAVQGGTTSQAGRVEADLDIEVALSTAPLANVQVFEAPNNLGFAPLVIETMTSHGITVASDSWGLCEPVIGPGLLEAENNALQVAAASGMSFFAASGDDGASDCSRADGSLAPAVDDPASQPFVTAVGGTTVSGSSDTSWKGSGGGVSSIWTRPAYQAAVAQTVPAFHCTNSTTTPCREVPDISMDANPNTGYIIYCYYCFTKAAWWQVGGTSGAAPLAAGMAALANSYSLANGGQRMAFANPFLYSTSATTVRDVTSGSSNNLGGGGYSVGSGYDMVTGLGVLSGGQLGQQLAAYSGAPVSTNATTLTVTAAPAAGTVVTYPHKITISGHLQDGSANPLANVPVHVWSSYISYRAMTNASGNWSVTFAPRQNATWHPVFTGSDVYKGSTAAGINLRVRPALRAAARLPYSSGRYHATTGKAFTVTGATSPNMYGAVVTLEYHVYGSTRWHVVKTVGVGRLGGATATSTMPNPHSARYYRWFYTGKAGYRWVSAVSPTILIVTP